ncbi:MULTISPECIES: glycosyltransferase [Halobacterium]|uniref:glycosyltransferase n=1 Tax=Halobacterium TaxID=2239 RepID=UPI0009E75F19|nr:MULTISPECIES: glycosyltransferase [Halobacterium]MCG1003035.1 glycosyltransferase [Halobacterium noricense]
MDDVAVATKVFTRYDHLRNLLESVEETDIRKVYISDDGDGSGDIYDEDWDLDLHVIDLEYDAGLGLGRKKFVEESNEDYLLVVDTDHEIPANWQNLKDIIEYYPTLGGVSGIVVENGRVSGMCHDIKIENDVLVRYTPEKETLWGSGHAFIEFDFVPNAILLRRECLEEYNWDPEYVIEKEHLDFFYGHYRKTDWEFGVCPSVVFPHHDTVNKSYLQLRTAEERKLESKGYFLNKWDLSQIQRESYWLDRTPHENPIAVRVANLFPRRLAKHILNMNDRLRPLKKYL